VLTKSRRRSGESSGGFGRLGARAVKDDGEVSVRGASIWSTLPASGFGGLGRKTIGGRLLGLGLKTQVRF
jgi:hypothetical protein